MRRSYTFFTIPICSLACAACGHAGRTAGAPFRVKTDRAPALASMRFINGDYDKDDYESGFDDADNDDSHRPKDRDNDSDSVGHDYFDSDDSSALRFGHVANAEDRLAIATLVRRYYAAGVVADGAAACSMIDAPLAKSVPADLGRPPSAWYYRGGTCAAVMSKLFQVNRRALVAHTAELRVNTVRVEGSRGLAVMSFKDLPGREIRVSRESGRWMLAALIDSELP